MKQPYNTALYYRLSRDDENFGDSVSIETQRTILQQFARDNQFHVVEEYIDDGWSGTNFDRPAFQRMMNDVEEGRINCIITKDLSRFGREHVMMDYYLEFVFPEKKIRYIAVKENRIPILCLKHTQAHVHCGRVPRSQTCIIQVFIPNFQVSGTS